MKTMYVEHRPPEPPVAAFTISSFCEAHKISRAFYYKLKAQGRGPREARITPDKPIITQEAAAEWRRRMELESAHG